MSVQSISWAFAQPVIPATRKFVLVSLANFSGSEDGVCFPSTETLSECTGLDRKTVVCALDDLVDQGYIEDTGARRGKTKQVKVYKLKLSQKRKAPKNGTVPFFPRKAPVFPAKGSQKRDTDPVGNQKKEPIHENGGPIAAPLLILKARVNVLFKRTDTAPWGCEEEHQLVEIGSRPDCLSEISEIEAFFKLGKFRPQKVLSLLRDWTGTLDRARNLTENESRNGQGDKPSEKSLAEKELEKALRAAERMCAND